MNIKKYQKLRSGKYKVYLDDQEIDLFEEVIIKYKLLLKKEIDQELLDQILIDNDLEKNYNKCLKYISTKMRSKKEIIGYLTKNGIGETESSNYIKKLESIGFINDVAYAKAYINDKLYLSNMGPYKIKRELLENNINENIIDEMLDNSEDIIQEKLIKMIDKKIKIIKNKSMFLLKQKILNDLISLGYKRENIIEILNNYENIDDEQIFLKQYNKIYKKLSKKYSGELLEHQIRQKLYKLGFSSEIIEKM